MDSSNDGVVTELAHLLIQDGQVQEGEQLAMDLIARKKTSYGPAYDLMYSFYLNANRPADAENVLKAKVNNNPKNADYVLQLARHYNRAHNTADMQAALQRLLDDPKDFPQARLWVGDFYLGLQDYPEAIGYYQQGADASPEAKIKVVYQIRNVLALLSQGKKDEAARLAEQVKQRESEGQFGASSACRHFAGQRQARERGCGRARIPGARRARIQAMLPCGCNWAVLTG